MAVKTFNYTNDKYIDGVNTRAMIGQIVGNNRYAYLGALNVLGNTVTIPAGVVIIHGGLAVHVLTDESFDTSQGQYIAVKATYEDAPAPEGSTEAATIEKYTCEIVQTDTIDDANEGEVKRYYVIYDRSNPDARPKGLAADTANDALRAIDAQNAERAANTTHYANITVGLASAGYTADTVDILISDDNQSAEGINSAIQALPAVGGLILLMEGAYIITSPVLINRPGVHIRGMGTGSYILRSSEITDLISVTAAATHSSLSNVYIYGQRDLYTSNEISLINVASKTFTFNNCLIESSGYGIFLQATATDIKILNCEINYCYMGVYMYGTLDNVYSLLVSESKFRYSDFGIYFIDGFHGAIICSNNEFTQCVTGTRFDHSRFIVENNVFNSCTNYAIQVEPSLQPGDASGNISGNMIYNSNYAISINGYQMGINISGNHIYMFNVYGNGIQILGESAKFGNITGNFVRGDCDSCIRTASIHWAISGNSTNGGTTGIYLEPTGHFCTLSGNVIINASGTALNIGSNYNSISGNNAAGHTQGLFLVGTRNAATGNVLNMIAEVGGNNMLSNNLITL